MGTHLKNRTRQPRMLQLGSEHPSLLAGRALRRVHSLRGREPLERN